MIIGIGVLLVVVGLIATFTPLFRLPGDIFIRRGNFTFAFPLVSSIIISIILTVLLNLFLRR